MRPLFAAVAIAAAMTAPAMAQTDDRPDTEGGRYMLREVDGDYLRVDRESGDTSVCRHGDSGWTCTLVADDRKAYEDEIGRLTDENADLARQVDTLRQQLAALRKDGSAGQPQGGEGLESTPDAGDDLEGGPEAQDRKPGAEGDNDVILRLPSDEDLDKMSQTFETVMRRFVEMLRSLKSDLDEQQQKPQ